MGLDPTRSHGPPGATFVAAGTLHFVAPGVVEPFARAEAAAHIRKGHRPARDAPELCFSVREPFVSRASAGIVWGDV